MSKVSMPGCFAVWAPWGLDVLVFDCPGASMPGGLNVWVPECLGIWVFGCWDALVSWCSWQLGVLMFGFLGVWIAQCLVGSEANMLGCFVFWVPWDWDVLVFDCPGASMPGGLNVLVPECLGVWVLRRWDALVSWCSGRLEVLMFGFSGAWIAQCLVGSLESQHAWMLCFLGALGSGRLGF